MKKTIILAFSLIIAFSAGRSYAQTAVTSSTFIAKTNQLDSYIASGDTVNSRATWTAIHNLMLQEFGYIKVSLNSATTTSARTAYMNLHETQYGYYKQAWVMKNNLPANRSAIHIVLMNYAGTL